MNYASDATQGAVHDFDLPTVTSSKFHQDRSKKVEKSESTYTRVAFALMTLRLSNCLCRHELVQYYHTLEKFVAFKLE